MEADRPQENRPRWLFKGLLMGVLILVALGLGVSLVGPGGAGGGPGSGPGEEPVVAGGGEALRKESLEDGPGRTPQPAGSRQGDAAGAAGAGVLPGGGQLPPAGLTPAPGGPGGLQGSATVDSSTGGAILDAVNGKPIGGATVRLTWFHGSAELSLAGLSPLGAAIHRSAGDGSFNLPLVEPEDPRLLAHVQVSHPGYATRVCVLHGRQDSGGSWTEVEVSADTPDPVLLGTRLEIYLRRTPSVPLRLLGPDGRGLAHAPLAVRPWREDHSFLEEPEIEWTWSGRLVRPGPWRVFYTDEEGVLRLPFSENPWDVDLLHPLYFLYGRRQQGFPETVGIQRLLLPAAGELVLQAQQGSIVRHQLVDLGERPLAHCEIEIELEGMPVLRTRTDAAGWFELGIHPFPGSSRPVSINNRRAGRLTVLSPFYWKRSVALALPAVDPVVLIEAHPASTLGLRLVSASGEAPAPVAADGLRTTLDMTLLRLGAQGEVSWCGTLPAPGSSVGIVRSGYLPVTFLLPAAAPPALSRDVDIGDLSLARGWQREVQLHGAGPEALAGARLSVSRVAGIPAGFDGLEVHRYRPGPAGKVLIGGLESGQYLLSVDGPLVQSLSLAATIFEENLDEPLRLPLQLSAEELVRVAGVVGGLQPLETRNVTVVERYFIAGREEPLAMPPYPLSMDGVFGSVREIRGVEAVEINICTPDERGTKSLLSRGEGPPEFDFGELALRRPPHAELEFYIPGYSLAWPPLNLSLEGEAGNEVASRLRLSGQLLVIDNLRMGRYVLRWRGVGGEEESFLFEVRNSFGGKVRGRVERRLLPVEVVEIDVVDSRGARVEGARVVQENALLPPGLGAGHPALENRLFATVRTRQETAFSVEAPGYLPAFVRVAPGEVVPRNIVLYRDLVRVIGRVLDTGGEPFNGILEIDWTPLTPAVIRHGQPLQVEVLNGRLRADGLLPQPRDFIFRARDSSSFLRRRLAPAEERRLLDLGVLRLGETRALRGFVYLDGGEPASGAVVALMPIAEAYRYPGADPVDFARLRWKTKTDEQGSFELGELPLALPPRWALVAHLDGFSDAVEEDPVLDALSRELFLDREAVLELNIGYANPPRQDHHAFRLEYQADPADPGSRVDLGELPPEFFGLHRFEGVRPGQYRVKWGLRDLYEPVPPAWEDVFLPAGGLARLDFFIEGLVVGGRARLNGLPVEKGWVILTHNPGENGGARVGRIIDGEFELVDPPNVLRAWAAVIPQEKNQVVQNIYRGEALPVEVKNYRSSLRSGSLEVAASGHNLRLELDRNLLLRYPGAVLSFEHWQWDGKRFRGVEDSELIESSSLEFGLLLPGSYRFTIRSELGSVLRQFTVPLRGADVVLPVR